MASTKKSRNSGSAADELVAQYTIDNDAYFPNVNKLRDWHRLAPSAYEQLGEKYVTREQQKRIDARSKMMKEVKKKVPTKLVVKEEAGAKEGETFNLLDGYVYQLEASFRKRTGQVAPEVTYGVFIDPENHVQDDEEELRRKWREARWKKIYKVRPMTFQKDTEVMFISRQVRPGRFLPGNFQNANSSPP